jgi:hypothetical protein
VSCVVDCELGVVLELSNDGSTIGTGSPGATPALFPLLEVFGALLEFPLFGLLGLFPEELFPELLLLLFCAHGGRSGLFGVCPTTIADPNTITPSNKKKRIAVRSAAAAQRWANRISS